MWWMKFGDEDFRKEKIAFLKAIECYAPRLKAYNCNEYEKKEKNDFIANNLHLPMFHMFFTTLVVLGLKGQS